MEQIGKIIKFNRISKKITLDEVSKELKISKVYLKNIEDDLNFKDYDIVFYIGHIRSYSNFLNLDADEIVKKFKKQISFQKQDKIQKIPKPNFQKKYSLIQTFFPYSLIILIISSFYLLFINEDNKDSEYALVPDLPESYLPLIEEADLNKKDKEITEENYPKSIINEQFSNTSAIASNKLEYNDDTNKVTLKLLNPTWLQLRDKSDNIIISRLMEKNDEYTYDLKLDYNITAGNAGNILVIINSDVRGKIGKYGEVVDSLILDYNFKN
tara:strand:- start:230 stop:1036 length:807 start_codon:yes stop_codon:yes gene_type:complete